MGLTEIPEEMQPVFELARRQEVAAGVVATCFAHRLGLGRVPQEIGRAFRRVFDAVDEVAVLSVVDLHGDAAAASAYDRPTLPESFAHGQPEAFAQRLLHHDVGGALKRVDLYRPDLLDVRQEVDI